MVDKKNFIDNNPIWFGFGLGSGTLASIYLVSALGIYDNYEGNYKTISKNTNVELQRTHTPKGILAFLTLGEKGDKELNGNAHRFKIEDCTTSDFKENEIKNMGFSVKEEKFNYKEPIKSLESDLKITCKKKNTWENNKEALESLLSVYKKKHPENKSIPFKYN